MGGILHQEMVSQGAVYCGKTMVLVGWIEQRTDLPSGSNWIGQLHHTILLLVLLRRAPLGVVSLRQHWREAAPGEGQAVVDVEGLVSGVLNRGRRRVRRRFCLRCQPL